MPKALANWTFKDVEQFLKAHRFAFNHTHGSHYFYKGIAGGQIRDVCVPFHGRNTPLKPRTMKGIMLQSGIDQKEWIA